MERLFLKNHAVKIKRATVHPNLVLFKYDIEADWSQPEVRECRGLILDEANNWAVVAHPFNKFFNAHEVHADPIDWESAKVYTKLDGSLMTLYHYAGHWWVSTTGTPDAECAVNNNSDLTFSKLFNVAINSMFSWSSRPAFGCLETHKCYCFELTGPDNRVVVPYKDTTLTMLGARNLLTDQECDVREEGKATGFNYVRPLPLTSPLEVTELSKKIRPNEGEGYVVCDKYFRRIKIKSPAYVKVSKLMNGPMTGKNMLSLVRSGESTEFIGYFPEFLDLHTKTLEQLTNFKQTVLCVYASISGIEQQKEFAFKAMTYPFSSILFSLRKHAGTTIDSAIQAINDDKLYTLMGGQIDKP